MKKSLSQAIALATLVGAAASANAMNVNPDGQGEAFLMPLYTADNGNVTTLNVTNTTDKIKAVKVRFLEGMNSKEVLDFNLYLSPYDQWSAAVGLDANGTPRIYTEDTSCTVGAIPAAGQPFVNVAYREDTNSDAPAAYKTIERAKVGHVELIEMGEINPDAPLVTRSGNTITARYAIVHNTNPAKPNQPGDCSAVSDAFKAGGLWASDTNAQVTAPKGGLYATGAVLNVDGGWQSSYDAVALDNTAPTTVGVTGPRQFKPGSELPNFQNFNNNVAFKNGFTGTTDDGNDIDENVNAVSALLMKESIQNDYVVGAGLNAQTDLTITFPTKTFYVNGVVDADDVHEAAAPFGNRIRKGWDRNKGMACEAVTIRYWDHEENESVLDVSEFSPSEDAEAITLCHETNILSVSGSKAIGGEGFVRHNLDLKAGFNIGWLDIDFLERASGSVTETYRAIPVTGTGSTSDFVMYGLPVIGFSTIVIQNGDVGGLMSNYAATYEHKATTSVDF
ncbi:MAG: hypothetical protein GXZ05_08745 [Gammaproteobacteria bacterium]|nr:hypothetical protein [Gammaproteobacteria bacterium]